MWSLASFMLEETAHTGDVLAKRYCAVATLLIGGFAA